jgi:hypothetical protein
VSKLQQHTVIFQVKNVTSFSLKLSRLLVNAAFAMPFPDVISRGHLASFVILLAKQLKYSTLSSRF